MNKMKNIILVFTFIFLSIFESYSQYLVYPKQNSEIKSQTIKLTSSTLEKRLSILNSWMGQTESKGSNRSPLIDSINRYVKAPLGSSYCAGTMSFSYFLATGDSLHFRTGLARALRNKETFTAMDVIMGRQEIKKGYFVIWQDGETINGHVGAAREDWEGIKGGTYEGNTSSGNKGSQSNGGGFYPRERKIDTYSYMRIKWITPVS